MFELNIFFEENDKIKNSFEQLDSSFKFSLRVNSKLKYEITNVYKRTLNNYAKFVLGGFQLTLFEKTEQIIRIEQNDEITALILAFTDYMKIFFDETYHYINFKSIDDIDELKYFLNLSLLLIDDALDEKNVELLFESFFQIESRIKREFPLVNSFHFNYDISFNNEEDDLKNNVNYTEMSENYVLHS